MPDPRLPDPGRSSAPSADLPRREQLLSVAAELFATRGVAHTTVRDIADEAGIQSASIYHHFASKQEILLEIVRRLVEQLRHRRLAVLMRGDDPTTTLEKLAREAFAVFGESPHATALLHGWDAPPFDVFTDPIAAEAAADIETIWRDVLAAGQERGYFRGDLHVGILYRFLRDTVWARGRFERGKARLVDDRAVEQYVELLYTGLRGPRA